MVNARSGAALLGIGALTGALFAGTPAQADGHPLYFLIDPMVNNGRPVVLGNDPKVKITVPVRAEVWDQSGGVDIADGMLKGRGGYFFQFLNGPSGDNMECVQASSESSICTGTATFGSSDMSNPDAGGTIMVDISGFARDAAQFHRISEPADEVAILKQTRLTTADATPEPSRKGGTLTVTGKLTQPDWNYYEADGTQAMVGYAGQQVVLQFRKTGSANFSTVKTVRTASDGTLRTTAAATWPGEWRWSFAGSASAAGSTSGMDAVTLYKVARLTANAAPEPVRKNRNLTVTGRLTRATTDAATTFTGYGSQSVRLQFRKTGSGRYKTVKTVRADAKGNLKTVVKATATGYWRWVFAGSATVAPVSAAGDHVKVTK
ncbi:hypothetical protein [Actinoplanes derwentensis]|uniref:Calcium-binding protein n=1 Tax=Actinoplanes derwentensis TaxID=113562 RepID=A0A1H1V5X5_9ACTN|nr:hypothetical protein [Actinoplanes derwentensis]GID89239.1 hypothetical protein Ade03nite_81630 [Actinoplanes derwentensis]SDS80103.1 hypothetical protein SAMN04489716_1652 [Actinoplanes derwentensis]